MQVEHERCCGIDVHKETVVACVIVPGADDKPVKETRTFNTLTGDLKALAHWLTERGVTHVAMESTGVYWKPVYNLLEGQFQVLVVNAEHLKKVAGRKTEVADAEWIAELLRHGLLNIEREFHQGSAWFRRGLVEAAHGAARTKDEYFKNQYHRLAGRRGKKRAIVAVGHSLLVTGYHMITRGQDYEDLGANYFDERNKEMVKRQAVKRLEKLGFQVQLKAAVPELA